MIKRKPKLTEQQKIRIHVREIIQTAMYPHSEASLERCDVAAVKILRYLGGK